MLASLFIVELMSRILQAVEETVARSAICNFRFEHLFQFTGIRFRDTGRKDNALAFLDVHFKIAGNVKVFIEIVATFLFFRILNSSIPVGLEMELVFLVQLHEQLRITWIHTSLYTIFYQLIVPTCLGILMRVFAYTTKSQERPEAQGCGRMGIDQSVTYQNAVLVMYKNLLLTKDNASHTVSCRRDILTVELTDIFMSVGTEMIALILVQSQVKLCTMLNYRLIQRRE